jgi:hypothetical protein
MTLLGAIYLLVWWLAVFDAPADGRSAAWCIGAAVGCAAWPALLTMTLVELAVAWAARNVK